MKTTNYYNTFIEVAEDCPVGTAEIPPMKGGKRTVANIQYELLDSHPYKHTSDDVLFDTYMIKNNICRAESAKAQHEFFSKGQPCFRASPLTKRYGWGVHSDVEGRIAIYAIESNEYARLSRDPEIKNLKALRSKRK